MAVVDMDRIREQGRRFVEGFTPGQKAMTILGVIAVVLAGMTFMRWASTPDYSVLYAGLSSEDAGAVTQQLEAEGIKYKISGGGGTVLVPRGDVYKTRASLSAKGVPSGGDGFSMLEDQGITTDQFTRNVTYQRALAGELGKTIEAMDPVASATVNLTIPQQTVFVGADQEKATAAVLVKPKTGSLPSSTVDAIVHLVASSIPSMSANDVTVADSNGKVLHAPGMENSGGAQVEQKQQYEAAVKKKIEDMIATTIGPNHAAVSVSAELDMSKSKQNQTIYTRPVTGPDGQQATTDIPIKNSTTTETFTQDGGSTTGGQLGIGNTVGPTIGADGGEVNYSKSTNTATNALDSTEITAETPPGKVTRMSVSVILDEAAIRPEDLNTRWIPAISAAAGINTARDGAQALQVSFMPFTDEAKAAATVAPASGGGNAIFDLIKTFLTLVIVGVILFFAWKAIKRAEANRVPLRVPLDVRELEAAGGGGQLALAGAGAAAVAAPAATRKPIEPPPITLEGEITELIERQPDEVAQTLRSWLADRRS